MKTWDQEVLHNRSIGDYGDCMRACLRTLIQDPLPNAPHPIDHRTGWWSDNWESYLKERGFQFKHFKLWPGRDSDHVPEIVIASGPSERGINHAVIWNSKTNELLHDPHPSRSGLCSVDWYWWI